MNNKVTFLCRIHPLTGEFMLYYTLSKEAVIPYGELFQLDLSNLSKLLFPNNF